MGLSQEVGASRLRWKSSRRLLIGLVLMAIAAGCGSSQESSVASVHSGLVTVTSSPMIEASRTAAASPTTDPASFASDPRLEACGGLEAGVEQVVALDHAWAYRAIMPTPIFQLPGCALSARNQPGSAFRPLRCCNLSAQAQRPCGDRSTAQRAG
jgi:hypothetical protein